MAFFDDKCDMDYLQRILAPPSGSFFLLGPRGTGKSTWVSATFPEAHTLDLLSERTYQQLLADPAQFAARLRTVEPGSWVVVDEIQRLPNLLNEVHRFIEQKQLRFVLCGSSARKLRRAGVNLLAGRALRRSMHPFVPNELGEKFDLAEALRFGLMPIVWSSKDRGEVLQAYGQLYLKEEIQAEALVRNLSGFARFLPLAALFHGQTVNVSNIVRDAGVARTTVTGYLQILEEALMCFQIPGYEAKLRMRERKLPKLYWCDPGIVRAMKRSFAKPAPEETGALFEGLGGKREGRSRFSSVQGRPGHSNRSQVRCAVQRGLVPWPACCRGPSRSPAAHRRLPGRTAAQDGGRHRSDAAQRACRSPARRPPVAVI
jgi:predicted AAA+ superfamily ATPase